MMRTVSIIATLAQSIMAYDAFYTVNASRLTLAANSFNRLAVDRYVNEDNKHAIFDGQMIYSISIAILDQHSSVFDFRDTIEDKAIYLMYKQGQLSDEETSNLKAKLCFEYDTAGKRYKPVDGKIHISKTINIATFDSAISQMVLDSSTLCSTGSDTIKDATYTITIAIGLIDQDKTYLAVFYYFLATIVSFIVLVFANVYVYDHIQKLKADNDKNISFFNSSFEDGIDDNKDDD